LLKEPVDAFVWWQGESDALADTTDYHDRLRALVGRVREAVGNPNLLVVIVRITNLPAHNPYAGAAWTRIREVQAAVVAADHAAILVSSDDLVAGGPDVPPAKLSEMADRVLRAIDSYRAK
jgi:hypothetical protein